MIWQVALGRQAEALMRIVVALAAIAGVLDAARLSLPRPIYRALLRPLREAKAMAARLPPSAAAFDPVEAPWLLSRFQALCRVIDDLIRQVLEPGPRPIRTLHAEARRSPPDLNSPARSAAFVDTS